MLTILATIFVFGVLVTVHELGHFATAKWTGMRVDEFAIGFGPKIYQKKYGETLYSIRIIPLGGFNKIAGMDPDEKAGDRGFNSKPILSRMIVILAGSVMNFILPVVLFFSIFFFKGIDVPVNAPIIGQVFPNMPAVEAGLMPGDKIVSINSVDVNNWDEVVKVFAKHKNTTFQVKIDRANSIREYSVEPKYEPKLEKYLVGIAPKYEKKEIGVVEAANLSVSHTKNIIIGMVNGLYKIISGKSPAEVAGPIGVAQMAGQVAQEGFLPLLTFVAFLSINLGVVNLLPLPALDGGHFILLILEAVRRKPLPGNVLEKIQIVGVAIILLITIFSTFKDLTRIKGDRLMDRHLTRTISLGNLKIGGNSLIRVQSMTNTKTEDVEATVAQIQKLTDVGCEIVRCAVPNMQAASALKEIIEKVEVPIIADIHFDYKLALAAMEAGVNGLRINPGNIGSKEKVVAVVEMAKEKNIPIRIGVNAGSLPKELLEKFGRPTPEALVDAAWEHIKILESLDFKDIKISLKSHDVQLTLAAYRLMASQCNYPLHVGITEAGTINSGIIKSAVGIGALLAEGIGDTIRVSLTGDPVEEVKVAFEILKALGLRTYGPTLVSCPTCGRTQINLEKLALEVEKRLSEISEDITVAVMGCVVNGPGEAREADIGIAGGINEGLIFKKGKVLKKVKENEIIEELFKEINKIIAERKII